MKSKIVPKSVQKCFGVIFSKKIYGQCSMFHGGSSFRKFSKKLFSKFQKRPKSFPKVSKRVLKLFWGKFFRNFFLRSVRWRLETSKIFLKIKKFSKFQKCPKPFPKESKRVLIVIWDNFFEKFFPSFPWKVDSSKFFKKNQNIFKIPKMPKSVPKRIQTCFEHVLGKIF